jgi:hypothetical protein
LQLLVAAAAHLSLWSVVMEAADGGAASVVDVYALLMRNLLFV